MCSGDYTHSTESFILLLLTVILTNIQINVIVVQSMTLCWAPSQKLSQDWQKLDIFSYTCTFCGTSTVFWRRANKVKWTNMCTKILNNNSKSSQKCVHQSPFKFLLWKAPQHTINRQALQPRAMTSNTLTCFPVYFQKCYMWLVATFDALCRSFKRMSLLYSMHIYMWHTPH